MTKPLTAAATKFARDEEGVSLVEYGLLLSLVAVVCVAAITTLGTIISTMFSSLPMTSLRMDTRQWDPRNPKEPRRVSSWPARVLGGRDTIPQLGVGWSKCLASHPAFLIVLLVGAVGMLVVGMGRLFTRLLGSGDTIPKMGTLSDAADRRGQFHQWT